MSWNYRALVRFFEKEPIFGIHECHYARKGAKIPNAWSTEPVRPAGNSRAELEADLKKMLAACRKPILIEYTRKDGREALKEWSKTAERKALLAAENEDWIWDRGPDFSPPKKTDERS
jgi:hypothetical protein